jgi:hypothetical protein
MDSKFNFRADCVVHDKAYPALAKWPARPYTPEWREFVYHWPNTIPCELHEHCATHDFPYTISSNSGDFYTIGIGFFNFDVDYFALIPPQILESQTPIVFYYHEGDNPYHIKQRLDALCVQHNLSTSCYQFVSGNTAANHIPGFHWFPDHELLYWHRNQSIIPSATNLTARTFNFTLLSRTHKWWRATVVADLYRDGLLDHSLWSYNTVSIGDPEQDNPIEVDTLGIRADVYKFLKHAPYTCDILSADDHNNHHITEMSHYTDSYFNIVLETHFDADGSGGAFLTEKTFKPIKFAQPFVMVGAPGSLQALRDLGYRTFDSVIDPHYDTIQDNTLRWLAAKSVVAEIKQNPAQLFAACQQDVQHNQQLFLSSKYNRLNSLLERLHK